MPQPGLLDDLLTWFAAIAVLFALVRGWRAYREIDAIYHEDESSVIIHTIRDGTRIKVLAAGWFGVLTILGALGYGPFPVLRPVSVVIALFVLDLPSRYLNMVRVIRGEPTGFKTSILMRWFRRR